MARGRIFSDFELDYIRSNYTSKTRHDVARYLNRDVNSISAIAASFGLTNPKRKSGTVHSGAIKASGDAIAPSKSDATYEDSIRASTRQLGEAVAKLAAKMQRQAARERRA